MNKLFNHTAMYSYVYSITAIVLLALANNTGAVDYFVLDFEDGVAPPTGKGLPIWSLPPAFTNNYGLGNFFNITDTTAHSGKYSLQFRYDGRNNFCNTCGIFKTTHKKGLDGVDYFVTNDATDLSSIKNDKAKKKHKRLNGPAAQPGKIIYNKSNGFSKWEIVSVDNSYAQNDKLSVKLLKAGINGEKPEFNGGDKIAITRQCGVDGHIGMNIHRRSDCDSTITWFEKVKAQRPGQSIFRRVYLKPEGISPLVHQKLRFLRPDFGGPNKGNMFLLADSWSSKELVPLVTGFGRKMGGANRYKPGKNGMAADLLFKNNTWYYIEEQFKSATKNLAVDPSGKTYHSNGEYRLWFCEAGKEDTTGATPVLEVTGLKLPPLTGGRGTHISLWGNVQHKVDTSGYWYMDDIKISDTKISKAAK